MRLSKDDILKSEDVKTEEVEVSEWGGSVLVRGMTGRERDAFEASNLERKGNRMFPSFNNIRAKVVARCVVDDDGERMFTDAEVAALGEKSGAAIDRVYTVAARLSGLTDEDIEEMAANFGTPPDSGGSASASPNGSGKPSRNSSAH